MSRTTLVKTGCILRHSVLSGSVYAITRWSDHGPDQIVAHTKHDVTSDVRRLMQTLRFEGGRFVKRKRKLKRG